MDLNGDGILDVTSGEYTPGRVFFFAGHADGFHAGVPIPEEPLVVPEGQKPETAEMRRWMSTANFADLDGDSDLDLVLGNVKGDVFVRWNEGTRTEYRFGARVPLLTEGSPIKVVQKSDPLPVDWDGDGTLDLLIGDEAGDVSFFRGLPDRTFARGISLFTGRTVEPRKFDEAVDLLDRVRTIPGYRFRLATCDWNDDGKLDLLIGNCDRAEDRTIGHVYLLLRE